MTDTKNNHAAHDCPIKNPPNVGIFRRFFAMLYDGFLLIAILFIVSAIVTALNHGKAIEPDDTLYPLFVMTVFSLSYLYFAWFWINNGQTLGMKTWKMQLLAVDNNVVSWKTTAIRFGCAIFSWGFFGLGFLWSLFDNKKRCWHDIVSKTVLVDLKDQ
ncbi:MAG: hypothetical protein COB77_04535 [Gammaproteobacteria bacterium]|nr:RDD family protein [Gammaproteobacteria bacterium]PCI07464.1 MAG: hypothetical protein COB77_04535 [Gammaproteobacteria bacterium]